MYNKFMKCNICDNKGNKSINREKDRYIELSGKYVHCDCYEHHLTNKKKGALTEDEAKQKVDSLYRQQKRELDSKTKDLKSKDEFIKYVMAYYDTELSNYYLIKLQRIHSAALQGQCRPIPYCDMLEMYKNPKVRKLLERNRKKNNVTKQPYHYDLTVLIFEYDNYRKAKEERMLRREQNEENRRIMEEYARKTPKQVIEKPRKESIDVDQLVKDIFGD